MAEQSVTLEPAESKAVSFEATPHEAKTYQVAVDGLTGSFKAIAKPLIIDFPQLSILHVDGMPFASVVGTEATLAEPITMSRMRGVSLTWLNKTITPQPGFGMWWYLRYEPQFAAPMPPPGFALRPGAIPPVGQEAVAAILGCWAGGYYYPGLYDGVVTVSHMYGEYWATFEHSFRIKNLARVTGTGTVVPPGY